MSILLITLLLLVNSAAPPTPEGSVDALVRRMETVYASIHDLQADFTQVEQSKALGRRLLEKGKLWLRRPGLMRWEYQIPEEKLFVAQEETTLFWVPADNQLIEAPRNDLREAGVGALLLDGAPSFRDRYAIAPLAAGDLDAQGAPAGTTSLRFDPREHAAFAYAIVDVAADDALARRIVVVDASGNRTEYLFDNIRVNAGVDPSLFRFTPPAGAEIQRR